MTDSEINEAVARKLGWNIAGVDPVGSLKQKWIQPVPDYCHSIAAAWEIVEYLKSTHDVEVGFINQLGGFGYSCTMGRTRFTVGEKADSAPMAICLAFLRLDA